jgi:hypothetical protein
MFEFELGNGLRVQMRDPMKSYDFGYHGTSHYDGAGCELDLRYEALMEPHDSALPSGSEEWGAGGHYEQSGRMSGQLRLGSETIEIDCFSQRDRSWGVRRLVRNPRGHFVWGIGSESCAFNALAMSAVAPAEDSGIGTFEEVLCGYYLKDGLCGDFTPGSGKVSVVERAIDGRPVRFLVDATDHLGRTLQAEGRTRNMLNWQGYSWLMQWWPMVEWRFDGQTVFGEGQDFWPLQQARKLLRTFDRRA